MKTYYVYILTNRSGTLYVGVTNDIYRRLEEHRAGKAGSFTKRYRLDRLVFVESTDDVEAALSREKQIKGWTRKRKLALIAAENPTWRDLSEDWAEPSTTAAAAGGEILRSAQNDNVAATMLRETGAEPSTAAASAGGQILRSAQNDNLAQNDSTRAEERGLTASSKEPTHV
jgi:putative endonuclease